jgi:hypothetical protein
VVIEHQLGLGSARAIVVGAAKACGMHPHVVRPGDVRAPQIADVKGLRRSHAELGQGLGEDLVSGFGNSNLVGEAQDLEVFDETGGLE